MADLSLIDSYKYKCEHFSDKGYFLNHNNIVIGFRYDPFPYVLCPGQAVSRVFDRGKWNGVWYCKIRKAPAVLHIPNYFLLWFRKYPLSLITFCKVSKIFW